MAKIGFIGMGNMATAIMKGLLKEFSPEDMIFSSAHEEKMEQVTRETGVPHAGSNAECARQAKYLVLAVKPQVLPRVFGEIKDVVTREQVIISIAAGYTISDLTEGLGGQVRVVRSMPNTPAMVGEGMTGVCYDEALFTQEEKELLHTLFTSFGKMELVEERLMDVVGSASGCSPAYVYMFIEALADGCVKNGLAPPDGVPDGLPSSSGKRKNGPGDRKASRRAKGYGLLTRRHHHRGCGGPGGGRLP